MRAVRRIAIVFVILVFLPSLGLGFLALRSAGEQRVVLERQSAALHQKDVDLLAARLREIILDRQRAFAERVRGLLASSPAPKLAGNFARELDESGAAFSIAPDAEVVPPAPERASDNAFVANNGAFLNNIETQTVFSIQQRNFASIVPPPNVRGQNSATSQRADFRTAIADGTDGVLARFMQNNLELILWTRPPEAGGYLFGLALPAAAVGDLVRNSFASIAPETPGAGLAVLDDKGNVVAPARPRFQPDWKHPFVESEIGDALPHWRTALYLLEPDRLASSARLITLTLTLLIALALGAILAGGTFVALDARRQLALAQKRTDFVSNVSHELKTPLTSIRMFAELLEGGQITDPAKRSRYLRIIAVESERLTRLINNVLDFARMERHRDRPAKPEIDLHPVLADVWESQSSRLREAGFATEWIADDPPYRVRADADAIGQIVVNLVSNAEKYSAAKREVVFRTSREDGELCVAVLDRGVGVPAAERRRIFQAFHRANDSLASGVQGSGLGLTLAQRIAQDHGGRVTCETRAGGGTVFTLYLPLVT